MSIMDFFKPPVDSANKGKEDQSNAPENKGLSDNPATKQADGKMPGTGEPAVNPLDTYAEMFKNAAKAKPEEAPAFKLDEKVLTEVSSKMDFMKGIPPELVQKAQSGDAAAMMQMMQISNQNAYKAALEHSSALTDTYLNQRSTFEQSKINSGVREQLTHQALASTPNYNHPVIKAELNSKAAEFAKAYPDLPPQEIAKAAQKYINDLYAAMNPADPNKTPDGKEKEKEMDWTKYLSS